jgi:Ice-binding-like
MKYPQKYLSSCLLAIQAVATSFTQKVRRNRGVRARTLLRLTARLAVMVPFTALLYGPSPVLAAPSLGSAQSFAVLATATVTSTGATIVTGDLGVGPGTAITGFLLSNVIFYGPGGTVTPGPGIVNGTIYAGGSVPTQAESDALTTYNLLALEACTVNLTGQDLGTLAAPLTPGVYCFSSSAQLTGTLVLDAQHNPNAVFIFKIGSTLTTASNSSVVVINGDTGCSGTNNSVFWLVGSSATLGTGTAFAGNILAASSITLTTGASVAGRAIALGGAVTMDTNNVSACGSGNVVNANPSSIKVTGGGEIPVPAPNSNDPNATGTGSATFGFNAKPSKSGGTSASGEFNYVNHITGLHINGPVTSVEVIAINPDGSPKTVRFAGTCDGNLPACSFSVTVEDNAEPGRIDEFGITVTGALSEARSQRIISGGNIQFHK